MKILKNGKFENFGKMKHGKLKKWDNGKPYGTIWYHKVPYGTIRYLMVP